MISDLYHSHTKNSWKLLQYKNIYVHIHMCNTNKFKFPLPRRIHQNEPALLPLTPPLQQSEHNISQHCAWAITNHIIKLHGLMAVPENLNKLCMNVNMISWKLIYPALRWRTMKTSHLISQEDEKTLFHMSTYIMWFDYKHIYPFIVYIYNNMTSITNTKLFPWMITYLHMN